MVLSVMGWGLRFLSELHARRIALCVACIRRELHGVRLKFGTHRCRVLVDGVFVNWVRDVLCIVVVC